MKRETLGAAWFQTLGRCAFAALFAAVLITFLMPIQAKAVCDVHSWGNWWTVQEPTCTENGMEQRSCRNCDTNEYRDIPATGHNWDSGRVNPRPTCTDNGRIIYICLNCKAQDIDSMPARGHDWVTIETQEATCISRGYTVKQCSICGQQDSVEGGYAAHVMGSWKTVKKATCTEDGEKQRVCTVCGKAPESSIITAKGHDWVTIETHEPTCISRGYTVKQCTVCGQKDTDEGNYGAHVMGSWKTVKKATCTEDGEKQRVCTVCGKAPETKGIAATGHDWATVETKNPTCTQPGYTVSQCTKCGLQDRTDIPKGSHRGGPWTTFREPTCTSDGESRVYCTICGDWIDQKTLPATGHTFGSWYVKTPAEVGKEGTEERDCSACGFAETRPIPALTGEASNPELTLTMWTDIGNQPVDYGSYVKYHFYIENTGNEVVVYDKMWYQYPNVGEWLDLDDEDETLQPGERSRYDETRYYNYVGVFTWDNNVTVNAQGEKGMKMDFYASGHTLDGREVISNTISFWNPLTEDAHGKLKLELVSDLTGVTGSLGDEIEVQLGLTNVGITDMWEPAGDTHTEYVRSINPNCPNDSIYYDSFGYPNFEPGDTSDVYYTISVTQDDIDRGFIFRTINLYANDWYYSDTGEVIINKPSRVMEKGHSISEIMEIGAEKIYSNTVNIMIPVGNGGKLPKLVMTKVSGDGYSLHFNDTEDNSHPQWVTCIWSVTNVSDEPIEIIGWNIRNPHHVSLEGSVYVTENRSEWYTTVTLQPGESYEDLSRILIYCPYNVIGNANSLYTWVAGSAIGITASGEEVTSNMIEFNWPVILDDSEDPDSQPQLKLELVPEIPSGTPLDKNVFHFIRFSGSLTNTGNETITLDNELIVYFYKGNFLSEQDPASKNTEGGITVLRPGESCRLGTGWVWVVQREHFRIDDTGKYISDRWYTYTGTTESGKHVTSNTCYFWWPALETDPENLPDYDIAVYKSAVSAPKNGQYYTEGESVEFELTLYNGSKFDVSGVKLYDQLISANAVFEADGPFAPGETIGTVTVKYTVTAADVLMGSIANRAYATIAETSDMYLSNEAKVVLDADAVVRYSPVTVIKTVTSTPANGVHYTEGEDVTYSVTAVNGGSEDVTAVVLYDCLNSGSPEVIDSASVLTGHDSLTAAYTHTVNAEDVARGYIDNYAYAVYVSGTTKRTVSYTVRVDTDGIPDNPPTGEIRRPGEGENPGTGRSDGTMCFADYTLGGAPVLSFCSVHDVVMNWTARLDDPAMARAMWESALETEYDEYFDLCDGAAKVTLLNEKMRFDYFIMAREQTLKAVYGGDMDKVNAQIAEILREKTVLMCSELYTFPDEKGGFNALATGDALAELMADMNVSYASMQPYFGIDATAFTSWLGYRENLLAIMWPQDAQTVQKSLEQDVLENTRLVDNLR